MAHTRSFENGTYEHQRRTLGQHEGPLKRVCEYVCQNGGLPDKVQQLVSLWLVTELQSAITRPAMEICPGLGRNWRTLSLAASHPDFDKNYSPRESFKRKSSSS